MVSVAVGSKGAVLRAPLAGFALLSYPLLQASPVACCCMSMHFNACWWSLFCLLCHCWVEALGVLNLLFAPRQSHVPTAAAVLSFPCSPRRRRPSKRPVPRRPLILVRTPPLLLACFLPICAACMHWLHARRSLMLHPPSAAAVGPLAGLNELHPCNYQP